MRDRPPDAAAARAAIARARRAPRAGPHGDVAVAGREDATVDLLRFGAALVTLVLAVLLFHAA